MRAVDEVAIRRSVGGGTHVTVLHKGKKRDTAQREVLNPALAVNVAFFPVFDRWSGVCF